MAYQRQTFIDHETVLTAAMMDHIEDGIVANETGIGDAIDTMEETMDTKLNVFGKDMVFRQIYPMANNGKLEVNSTTKTATIKGFWGPIDTKGSYIGMDSDQRVTNTVSWASETNPTQPRTIMFDCEGLRLVAINPNGTAYTDLEAHPENYVVVAGVSCDSWTGYTFTTSNPTGHWYFDGEDVYPNLAQSVDDIETDISGIEEDISDLEDTTETLLSKRVLGAKDFARVGCIGDDFTQGYVKKGGVTGSYEDFSWPRYMSAITGQVWTNFGKSGSGCREWVNGGSYSRLSEVQATGNKCQAYVIGLMYNDSNPQVHGYSPLGTAADIGTNADSYYAYYYKLINAVNAVNATAPIFCCTCPQSDSRFTGYNTAVRDIVTYCHDTDNHPVYLLDLAGDAYYNTRYYTNPDFLADSLNGRFSPLGYQYMAECMVDVMSDTMNASMSEFQEVCRIPYDAVASTSEGSVRYDVAQSLEDTQKAQARANIGAIGSSDVPTGVVRYDDTQSLTDAQKETARANIGAVSSSDIPTGVVRYDAAQSLTDDMEQVQARINISAERAVATELKATITGWFNKGNLMANSNGEPVPNTPSASEMSTYNPKCYYAPCNSGDVFTFTGGRIGTNVGGYGFLRVYEDPNSETGYSVESLYAYTNSSPATNRIAIANEGANWVYFINTIAGGANHNTFASGITAAAHFNSLDSSVSTLQTDVDSIKTVTQTVSGTTPSITAEANHLYKCGTLTELDFTPVSSGLCEVVFTSGTSATLVTLPSTVKMPEWWVGAEASRIYEISFLDGRGVVMSWPI